MSQPLATAEAEDSRSSHVVPATAPASLPVEAFGRTDIGQVREVNEDSYAVLPRVGLFMVADGMGGHEAGDVASRMAITCVRDAFEDEDTTWPFGVSDAGCRVPSDDLLRAALTRANGHIRRAAERAKQAKGMGTTFAGILVLQDRLVIAHVGDSRVYRLRGRQFDLLTQDHSLLNKLVHEGKWDPAEADAFPAPNAITRALGGDDELEVDTLTEVPEPDDTYLICSDGLHGMVKPRDLASIILKAADLTQAVSRMIERANDNGGHDNITAVLVRVCKATR